ncbi:arrestin domain-containing protein 1 [Protopterus annectens]|uniref:arrestin domain-containing protein 1 n=1 Tax=Protopterus annectens TaxID=7888 RepID=UPI001CF9C663|nr:arrestin domain-containing protein 1 [Protopterus annectens]
MGKLQQFDISLTDNKVVYGPGEYISGTVTVRVNNVLPYKAIKVSATGSCGLSTKANDTTWAVEEQYFNSTLSLADKGSLSIGEHTFPFQFLLPAMAPTSFEGPFGKIHHRIRAVIDTPRFAKDYKCEKIFYILNLLNLNEVPDVELRNTVSKTKKFSYMIVKSGTLSLTVTCDLKGYIPGQVIQLHTEIHNKSGKDTGTIIAALIQKVTYKSKRMIYDLRTIAEVEGSPVKAWKHAEWREQIIVPALPQSMLEGCSLIHIDYYIQVSLKTPEVSIALPIYIGNIAINMLPVTPHSPPPDASAEVVPSAPPAEEGDDASASGSHPLEDVQIPTKSHSQQQPFSYAPGLNFPASRRDAEPVGSPSHPVLCVSTGATIPYFSDGTVTPVHTTGQLILPPEYSTLRHPSEPPPSYEESCSTAAGNQEN